MTYNVGLTVTEGESNGAAPFTEPSKRNIGLLMERERGIPNKPFRITSLAEDSARFGGFNANMFGPTFVRNLINNAKGYPVTIYGVRVAGSSSTPATTGTVTLQGVDHTYSAGQLGEDDPGTWGNNLTVKFFSFNYTAKAKYRVEIYLSGKLVESFEEATMAALQATINSSSMYITADVSAEYPIPSNVTGTGTITTTSGSATVTGVGTNFSTTTTPPGTLILNASGAIIGTVKLVNSVTSITLEKSAAIVVTGAAFKYYKRFVNTFTLSGGVYSAPTEAGFYPQPSLTAPKGLSIFDTVDAQILAVTEYHTLTMAQELNVYCANRQSPLGVFNYPLNASEETIESYATALQTNNPSFVAGYNAWVKTKGDEKSFAVIPALGCILGAAYIRTPELQGGDIHIPPAGIDSSFVDVVEVYPDNVDQTTLNIYTVNYTANSIVFTKGIGWYVETSRTMSTNPLYHSVHIRLMTSFYKRVLLNNMGWVKQKNNSPELKKRIYNALFLYFKAEYDKGALERSIPFSEAVTIICDQSNNPLSQSRKELNTDVNWIPSEATEAFTLRLNRNDGALLVTEA